MRIEKKAIIDEIRGRLEDTSFIIMTDYTGMKVVQIDGLRRQLARHGSRFHVVKNTFFNRAVEGTSLQSAGVKVEGSTAMVVGGDGVEAAKTIKEFARTNQKPVMRCGVFDGRLLSTEDVDVLVDLPARPVLYGMLAGTLAAPMTRLAGVMHQKLLSLVYVIKAARDKKEQA